MKTRRALPLSTLRIDSTWHTQFLCSSCSIPFKHGDQDQKHEPTEESCRQGIGVSTIEEPSPDIPAMCTNAGCDADHCHVLDDVIGLEHRTGGQSNSAGMIHLRNAEPREWTSFPQTAAATQLNLQFDATAQNDPGTLTLTQADVKESWTITLNKQPLGKLVRDENRLQTDFLIPAGLLKTGQNTLTIACRENAPADDILVGQIAIHPSPPESLRGAATLQVAITDQNQTPIPGRITLTNEHDILMPVGNQSGNHLAIREGVIYTATGEAVLGVAPGTYRITAGRGFEYSAPSTVVRIAAGETVKRTLMLERQVDTSGWIASDTHVHTVTYSGHGDCTIEERMATLAGEGIEFPIATDHNRQIDYQPVAETAGVTEHFTPVVGNEVTTKHGHFNVFPAVADGKLPDHNQLEWSKLFDDIYTQDRTRVAILNHARDLHSSFRPFSPRHHLSLTGDNLDGWQQEFNAMELINSGAVQTDPMELFLDWCGLINHGLNVTPVGCSDSHDVSTSWGRPELTSKSMTGFPEISM